jgi:hypothetical protein
VQQLFDALAGLGGHPEDLAGVAADDPGEFGGIAVRLGGGQVDLVQHRDDLEVGVERHVQVGQRLRLDALGGVDQQHRALAGGQAAGDLVAEVDVAGGVDEVEDVLRIPVAEVPGDRVTAAGPGKADRLALDCDAALALDVHPVQVLGTHLPALHHAGKLQHPVRQCRLTVIDVGDDAEVPDHRLLGAGFGVRSRAGLRARLTDRWHAHPFGFTRLWPL